MGLQGFNLAPRVGLEPTTYGLTVTFLTPESSFLHQFTQINNANC